MKQKLSRQTSKVGTVMLWTMLAFLIFLMAFPFIYVLFGALKSDIDLSTSVDRILPQKIQWINFANAWKLFDFPRAFLNSFIVSFAVTFGTILVCSMAAYIFTRMEFRLKNAIFMLYLSTMMIPITVRLIPSYILSKEMGFLNSYAGIILPQIAWNIPFGTFLMRQFFAGIPEALDEAAKIDGAGHIRTFARILLPNATAAMTTLGTYVFIQAWNNLNWVLLVASKKDMWTITLGLASISGASVPKQPPWNQIMAAIIIALIPVLLLYLIFQKYFIQSVAMSGIK